MTTKQLEQETGCKIMVRGRGSMRDKKKVSRGPNTHRSAPWTRDITATQTPACGITNNYNQRYLLF